MKKNIGAGVALLILLSLYVVTLCAPFFAPYRYDADDVLYTYAPPARVHIIDAQGRIQWPFVYGTRYQVNEYYQRVYSQDFQQRYPIRLFAKGFEYTVLGLFKTDRHFFGIDSGKVFVLGADMRGRDIFSRIVYGGRVSLTIGLVAACVSFLIGVSIGGIAGYFGGKIDGALMRAGELVMMFPAFYLMLALRAVFPLELSSAQVYGIIVLILSCIGWAGVARVVRGMALSLRQREYVSAARACGLSHWRIIIHHILPHTFSYVLAAIMLEVPAYIMGEAGLSMIGLGIQEPQASWGNMLAQAMGIVPIRLAPWILYPGLFILAAAASFNVLGDWLRDRLDVKRDTQ